MTKRYFLFGFIFLMPFTLAMASNLVRFQGRLTDSQGRPIFPSPKVSFELYNAQTGGERRWGPSSFQTVNTNESGLFSTDIGPFTDLSIFSVNEDLFLQITVLSGTGQTNQILSPRQRLGNVPFAFHANNANQAATSDTVPDGSISANKIQQGAVGSEQIADHSIRTVDLSTPIATQFIPSGMIALFAAKYDVNGTPRDCPDGWSPFPLLVGKFPLGVTTYAELMGGSSVITGLEISTSGVHVHTIPAHSHSVNLQTSDAPQTHGFKGDGWPLSVPNHHHQVTGNTGSVALTTAENGAHTHSITSNGSWLPPYLGIVYCQKD